MLVLEISAALGSNWFIYDYFANHKLQVIDLRYSFDKCANIIIWIVYPKEDQDIDVDLKTLTIISFWQPRIWAKRRFTNVKCWCGYLFSGFKIRSNVISCSFDKCAKTIFFNCLSKKENRDGFCYINNDSTIGWKSAFGNMCLVRNISTQSKGKNSCHQYGSMVWLDKINVVVSEV